MSESKSECKATAMRMKRFIYDHLHELMTAVDVARAAGYSQFHASRLFKAETGLALFEYIRRERLTASARALRSGKSKVIDITLEFVFDSHEDFYACLQ